MNGIDAVAIVTGAGRGIGRSVAAAYAGAGVRVVIAEKDAEAARETERLIRTRNGEAVVIETDVSRPEEIVRLVSETSSRFGRLDVLINNAGVTVRRSPYELSVEEWDRIIDTNLRSAFLCSREAAKLMRKTGGGAIVNIASTRALMSEPDSEAYAASKGGIIALTHALAASLARDRIRVNCISPGWIETGEYGALRRADHDQHFSGRVGRPDDIARACLYLTAPGNEFVNGVNLVIDGGMTRKMIYEE